MLLVVLLNSTLRVRFSSLVVMQLATSSLWLYTIFERGVYLSVTGKPIAVVFFFAVVLAISLATGRAFEVMARREFSVKLALGLERENADKLLRNVMPDRIATRIKGGEAAIADFHGEATVMFADLSGFTAMASNCSPRELVNLLNDLYSRFDDLTNQFGLEKLKTIGDAYMAVAGLEDQHGPHAAKAADCALAMLADLEAFNAAHGTQLALRVGLHTGPLIAGIVGKRQFAYDVWGDTVNVASRMESHGEPGRIQISEATYKHVRTTHRCANAGEKPVKGKGLMKTWFVNGRRGAYAAAILEAS
jgi:class 3 adenylate cyclase